MPGKGGKLGALKKTSEEEAGDNVQDVLAEMLAQSQGGSEQEPMFQDYQPQEPSWADQGSTDQMAVEDPIYGHGKGLKNMHGKAAPKMTAGFNPKTAPGAFKSKGGKQSIAKKASDHFFGKSADSPHGALTSGTGNSGLTPAQQQAQTQRAAQAKANPKPLTPAQRAGMQNAKPVIVAPTGYERDAAAAKAAGKPVPPKPTPNSYQVSARDRQSYD